VQDHERLLLGGGLQGLGKGPPQRREARHAFGADPLRGDGTTLRRRPARPVRC
jgi:hypothetical protein